MTADAQSFEIDFGVTIDERWAWETEARGVCTGVVVRLPNGERHRITFYDPVRLAQELADLDCIAEPGLVVIPKVSDAEMRRAIPLLLEQDYFRSLRPLP